MVKLFMLMLLSFWHHRLFFLVPLSSLLMCALICELVLEGFVQEWTSVILPHRSSIESSKWDFGFINWFSRVQLRRIHFPESYNLLVKLVNLSELQHPICEISILFVSTHSRKKLENTSKRANIKCNKNINIKRKYVLGKSRVHLENQYLGK